MTWSNPYSIKIWLSETAIRGCLRLTGKVQAKRHSIGSLLRRLPADPEQYIDMRPPELKDMDLPLLESGKYPIWDLDEPKIFKTITMTPRMRQKLMAISERFTITNYKLANSYRSEMSRCAAVVEALGLGLLDFRLDPAHPEPDEPTLPES